MPWELLRLFKLLSYLLCPTCSFPSELQHIFPWFLCLLTILALLQGSKEEGIMLCIHPNDDFICFLNLLNISSSPIFYKAHFNGLAWLGCPSSWGLWETNCVFSGSPFLSWSQHFKTEECMKIDTVSKGRKAQYSSPPLSIVDIFQDPSRCLKTWIVPTPIYTLFLPIHTYDKV